MYILICKLLKLRNENNLQGVKCKFVAAFNSSGCGHCHANTFKQPRSKDREKQAHLGKIREEGNNNLTYPDEDN